LKKENQLEIDPLNLSLKIRSGHSMTFDPIRKEILITGGSYRKIMNNNSPTNINDFMCYNTQSNTLKEIFHDFTKYNGPDVNFSSASYYDYNKKELYIFGGTYKNEKTELLSNNFWVYNFDTKKWNKAIRHDYIDYEDMLFGQRTLNIEDYANDTLNAPSPRFAHTMTYSMKLKTGFIFGGNPNAKINSHSERLNDFWSFDLKKQKSEDIYNTICLKIYKFQFEELCLEENIEKAINVLNDDIFPLIKDDERKLYSIRLLSVEKLNQELITSRRYNLYEDLMNFFNIIDGDEFLNR
jgi:hypothetical protein